MPALKVILLVWKKEREIKRGGLVWESRSRVFVEAEVASRRTAGPSNEDAGLPVHGKVEFKIY